jgi:putative SOS response-associated peptidase YedK
VCNLYTRSQEAMRWLFRAQRDLLGNFPGLPAVFPDTMAPVVRTARDGERELASMRWGFPPPPKPRQCAGHQCAQSEIILLARMAQSRMALPRSGNVILRMDG